MVNKTTSQLDEVLNLKEKRYRGSDAIISMSGLSFPSQNDSSRMIMFNSAKNQTVVPERVEKPMIFTNHEDMMGDLGSKNIRAKGNLVIDKIIKKFCDIDTPVQTKYVFTYNQDTGVYDVITRKDVEDLPEKYGFQYDNHRIDELSEGDTISVGTTLITPTCYDQFDNYGYGRNVTFIYQINDNNLEDAITVSESLAKEFTSVEVERVKVSINDNNALLNLMGDRDHYKAFPNVGEFIKNKELCVRRTLNMNQILFDYKEPNTRKALPSDTKFFNEGQVVDIDIYCNKSIQDVPHCSFNEQLIWYLEMNEKFNQSVVDYVGELVHSGCMITSRVKELYKRCRELLSPEYEVKDENNSKFSNIILYITVKRQVGLLRGQKLTGRHGNKGVIGKIVPDHLMYHVEDGRRIDVVFDTLGVINRLNCMQLFEQSITFRAHRVLERIRETNVIKEKEKLVFPFIRCFNPTEADNVYNDYKTVCKTTAQKREWFAYLEKYGIYINIPPFWREKSLYDCLLDCDKLFPWIEPYNVYFYNETSHRWVKQMTKQPIGSMYVMKLKQSSKKGLSARSTGSISKKGVPEKSDDAKKFYVPYSKIPIRMGIQENTCLLISMDPDVIAKENLLHRSSPVARRKYAKAQLTSTGPLSGFQIDDTMTNRNVEILSAYLLSMGLELTHNIDRLDLSDEPGVKYHTYKGKQYWCTSDEMRRIVARDLAEVSVSPDGDLIFVGDERTLSEVKSELADKIYESVQDHLSA